MDSSKTKFFPINYTTKNAFRLFKTTDLTSLPHRFCPLLFYNISHRVRNQ